MLTSCGMTTEEIDTAITQLDTAYQSGMYDEAKSEIENLDKSYNKMSDEQKNKFGELRSSIEYTVSAIQSINDGLNSVQSYYDQKLYYEAQQELDKVSQNYKLPPREQKKFDEKQVAVSQAITSWKIAESIQKAEKSLNSSDYNSASNILSEIDTSSLTEEQKQKIDSLKNKIASTKAEEERKKKESSMISADKAKQLVISHYGCASAVFNKEDDDYYYLVPYAVYNPIVDTYEHPMGLCKVNKKTGQVIEVSSSEF